MSVIRDKDKLNSITNFTKSIYHLKDFCNALKDNNCIIDTKVFINWRDLVGTSLYDSVRFVIFSKVDGLSYGQWIACNHDLVITDYHKQEWKDFYLLNENTSYIWERLLFQNAVKPVESFKDFEMGNRNRVEDIEDRNSVEDLMYALNDSLNEWNEKGNVDKVILVLESLSDAFRGIREKEKKQ